MDGGREGNAISAQVGMPCHGCWDVSSCSNATWNKQQHNTPAPFSAEAKENRI
jgi:hypothetical protein